MAQEAPSPFVQYSYLAAVDLEHRKQIAPRKRALRDAMESEMRNKNEKMRTEDGKNFFIVSTKKVKPSLTEPFLLRGFVTFHQQETPERNLQDIEAQAQRFVEHLQECRDKAAQDKTKMDHKKSRPPEHFF